MIERRSPRLSGWDYRTPGVYFITAVTRWRLPIFGAITPDGVMAPSDLGRIAEAEWSRSVSLFPSVVSHTFVVMPNHVHGIVGINLHDEGEIRPTDLTTFIGSYKSAISRRAGRPIWQRSFYDHIVRDERELEALWLYIDNNPARWAEDDENPDRVVRAGQAPGGASPAPTMEPQIDAYNQAIGAK